MTSIHNITSAFDDKSIQNFFDLLQDELHEALTLYWDTANKILDNGKIKLHRPSEDYFSLENNFFSALFLYSYFRGGFLRQKRVLFAAMNQCLRGMVTGCDNILDNEYKKTLDTDLPANAIKFRSILDIMVSDRILVAIMHKGVQDGEFAFEHILQASTASLHALLQSGVQEASEEQGAGDTLKPEEILSKIHPLKTGILFQAPWVLPELMEIRNLNAIAGIKEGLFQIGMGCQILDDMVDLSMDAQMNRHNYIVSLVLHGKNSLEMNILKAYLEQGCNDHNDPDLLFMFPDARKTATQKAICLLQKGTNLLFATEHKFMIDYSIDFFIKRIGANRFFKP